MDSPSTDLAAAFTPGARFVVGTRRATIAIDDAGEVATPGGAVAVLDPDVPERACVVPVAIGVGPHRVRLACARFEDGDVRCAAAWLALGAPTPAAVARWELVGSVGVDAALAAFADAAAVAQPAAVSFATGWGDGRYPIYVARDAAGAALGIAVDLHVLVAVSVETLRFPGVVFRWGERLDHPALAARAITLTVEEPGDPAREVVIDVRGTRPPLNLAHADGRRSGVICEVVPREHGSRVRLHRWAGLTDDLVLEVALASAAPLAPEP